MRYSAEDLIKLRPSKPGYEIPCATERLWDRTMFELRMSLGSGNNIEIGCKYGNSTIPMAAALANISPENRHFSIDPFIERAHMGDYVENYLHTDSDYYLPQYLKNITDYDSELVNYIHPLPGYSSDVIKSEITSEFSPVALMFIDGDHSAAGVEADIVNYHNFVKVGGVIAFDDWGGFGVIAGYEAAAPKLRGQWTDPLPFVHGRVIIKRLS